MAAMSEMTPENIDKEDKEKDPYMMVCEHCGARLPQDAVFCMNCGTRIADMTDKAESETAGEISSADAAKSAENTSDAAASTAASPLESAPQTPQPTVPPLKDGDDEQESADISKHRRAQIIVAVAVAVALVLGGGLGGWWIMRSKHDKAFAACESSVAQYADAAAKTKKAVSDNDDVSKLTSNDVGDQGLIDAYAKAEKAIPQDIDIPGCRTSMSADELNRNASKADNEAKTLTEKMRTLEKTATAVTDARNTKTLTDASTALKSKIQQAHDLIDGDGTQADSDTKNALQSAIDAADKAKNSKDVDAIEEVSKKLDDAMNAVTASAATNMTPCSAIAGSFSAFQAGGGLLVSQNCDMQRLDSTGQVSDTESYVPGSFKNNGDGTLSWETSGGPCTYLSPGVHGKQFDEFYSVDDVEDDTIGLPRIETNGPGGCFVKFMG